MGLSLSAGFVVFMFFVVMIFTMLSGKPDPLELALKKMIRGAGRFARDHHDPSDISDWHWQEFRNSLTYWYNAARSFSINVEAEYHELFVLNSEGEAVDIVSPDAFWRHAEHVGLLPPKKDPATTSTSSTSEVVFAK